MSDRPSIKFAIFFSGWGRSVNTCLNILLSEKPSSIEFACAVTIGQSSDVTDRIKSLGIKIFDDSPKSFESPEIYQAKLAANLLDLGIDYVFMLGYKYRIREPLLMSFPNRILNIHPSLLPSFKNTQSAIQDAMAYGVKVTGITTHIIDEEIDEGIILCQVSIPIEEVDDYQSMDEKFMKECRKIILNTFDLVLQKHHPHQYLEALFE